MEEGIYLKIFFCKKKTIKASYLELHFRLKSFKRRKEEIIRHKKIIQQPLHITPFKVHGFKFNAHHFILKFTRERYRFVIIFVASFTFSIALIIGTALNKRKATTATPSICQWKYKFMEDLLFVGLAFPLTALIYLKNTLSRTYTHSARCAYAIHLKNAKNNAMHISRAKLLFLRFFRCSCSFVLPIPMSPFSKKNRLISNSLVLIFDFLIARIGLFYEFLLQF